MATDSCGLPLVNKCKGLHMESVDLGASDSAGVQYVGTCTVNPGVGDGGVADRVATPDVCRTQYRCCSNLDACIVAGYLGCMAEVDVAQYLYGVLLCVGRDASFRHVGDESDSISAWCGVSMTW